MSMLGDLLKTEREKKGIRITDIASVTKIPAHNLKLMEEGNWKALPPKPFIKGFLVSYSKYVGLNPNEIYQKYLAEIEPQIISEVATTPEPEPERKPQRHPVKHQESEVDASEVIANPKVLPIKPIAISLGGLAVLVLAIWLIQIGKDSSSEITVASQSTEETASREVASSPESSVNTESAPIENAVASAPTTNPSPAAPIPTPTPAPEAVVTPEIAKTEPARPQAPVAQEGHQLEVQVKERSWAKVVVDNAPPVEFHLKAEEKTSFSAKEKIKLVLGNSTGAEVSHNGEVIPGTKYQGTVRYYIFPAGSKFPQDKTNRRVASEPQNSDQPIENETEESSEE